PVQLKISPSTSYARFVNSATTGKAGSGNTLHIESDVERSDGTRVVTLAGSVPADAKPSMFAYRVPQPSRFAEIVLAEALDVSGASQSDGAGADAHFTPDFMVHYLAFMATQTNAAIFHDALPVLGKDGTLWNIQVSSAAAGFVHAKTGTYAVEDLLHEGMMV